MTNEQLTELAISFGVATLETSAKLDGFGNTRFVWYQDDITEWTVILLVWK